MEREKNKAGKIIALIGDFISTFIMAVLVIVALAMVIITLLGWNIFSIDSYSMTPTYPINSLVVVQKVDASDIKVGDVITYVFDDAGTTVTHRVTQVNSAAQTFITKGDANESEDASPVLWGNVIGKVVLCIPFAGLPLRILTAEENRTAVIAVIIALILIVIVMEIVTTALRRRGKAGKSYEKALETEEEMETDDMRADGFADSEPDDQTDISVAEREH